MGYASQNEPVNQPVQTPRIRESQTVSTQEQDDWAEFQAYKQWKAQQSDQVTEGPEDEIPAPSPILFPAPAQDDASVEAGQLQTAIRSGQLTPELVAKLLKRLDDLEGQIAAQRVNESDNVGAPDGGAPVPHHLHLIDGTVITNHPGLATHVAHSDGRIIRVLHAFRADEDVAR